MADVIVMANKKGGVTKTTSTLNLAAAGAEAGLRVAAIDGDPQENLTMSAGAVGAIGTYLEDALAAARDKRAPAPTLMSQVEDPPGSGEQRPIAGGIDLLPCTEDGMEEVIEDDVRPSGDMLRLKRVIDAMRPAYDLIFIDTPPSFGPIQTLAYLAADYVVVPTRPADLDVEAVVKLYQSIGRFTDVNPRLRLLGTILTQEKTAGRSTTIATREARETLGGPDSPIPLLGTVPYVDRYARIVRYGQPAFVLEPDGRVAAAYRQILQAIREAIAQPPAEVAA